MKEDPNWRRKPDSLSGLREEIDRVDEEILSLLDQKTGRCLRHRTDEGGTGHGGIRSGQGEGSAAKTDLPKQRKPVGGTYGDIYSGRLSPRPVPCSNRLTWRFWGPRGPFPTRRPCRFSAVPPVFSRRNRSRESFPWWKRIFADRESFPLRIPVKGPCIPPWTCSGGMI